MPVKAAVGPAKLEWLRPTAAWKTLPVPVAAGDSLVVDPNFYVLTRNANAPPPAKPAASSGAKLEALWYATGGEASTRSFLDHADQISIVSPQVFFYDSLGGIRCGLSDRACVDRCRSAHPRARRPTSPARASAVR